MKRWRIITLCSALAAAAMLAAHLKWHKPAPTYQGQSLRYWLEKIEEASGPEGEDQAEEAVRAMGSEAVPYLVQWIEVRESSITTACSALRRRLPSAIEIRLPSARGSDKLRSLALWAIQTLGPQADAAVPALTRILDERDSYWVISAAKALGDVGPEGLGVLVRELSSGDLRRRRLVTESLIYSGATNQALVPPLVRLLEDRDCLARLNAVRALLRIAPENEAIMPTLLALLADKQNSHRVPTLWALYEVAPKATTAIPTLIAMLEQEPAEPAIPSLGDDEVVQVLGQMGPAAKDAVPVLIKRLRKEVNRFHWLNPAAVTLGKIGPAARPACPDLRSILNDTNLVITLRASAAMALWRIDRDTNAALPFVVQSLQSKAGAHSFGCGPVEEVEILGEIGPLAREAVPCLTKLLDARNAQIRAAAVEALRKIDPETAAKLLAPSGITQPQPP